MDLMMYYLPHVYLKPFHILFLSIGCVLTLVACIGAFKMHKSYTYQMSEEQKTLLKTYAIVVAIVSVLSLLCILCILYIFREKKSDGIYKCNLAFDNRNISVLVVLIFVATLGISSFVLYDRNYSTRSFHSPKLYRRHENRTRNSSAMCLSPLRFFSCSL